MDRSLYATPTWILCVILFAILSAAIELGFRLGAGRRESGQTSSAGVGAVEAAVFGLFGLLLALSFSFVMGRSDGRRLMLVEETNAIGTAYLRCDVAPDPLRATLRARIRDYVDQRVALIAAGTDEARADDATRRAAALQGEIWTSATGLVRERPDAAGYALLIDALNTMFDMQAARDAATRAHLPPAVLLVLALTASVTAVVAGYALGLAGERHHVASSCFVLLTVLVGFIIVDMDRPLRGLFRAPTGLMLQVQSDMKAGPP